MDHTLRRYHRAFEASPFDINLAQRYIRYLERALAAVSGGDISYVESPHELDYHVMRYRPMPGEFTEQGLDALREHAIYYGVEYGIDQDVNENDLMVSVSTIISEFTYRKGSREVKRNQNLVKVAKRAKQVGYKHIVITIDPDLHISENYRRTLAERGLEGSLKGMRQEAAELEKFLETWKPEQPPEYYSDEDIRQTPLYRYLILPKVRTSGHSLNMALRRAREMILEMWKD